MIEIKIPTAAAVVLLTQRMKYELGLREKAGKIDAGMSMKNLTFDELLEIAETAAFDISVMLPADILQTENNLAEIITRSIQSLSSVFDKEEFKYYTLEDSMCLLGPINRMFHKLEDSSFYLTN